LPGYIPEHKHDLEPLIELSKHEYPFYRDIMPELFTWIQDMNWPVAKLVAPLLVKAGRDVIPHVRLILKSDDSVWKYWVLLYVIDKMEPVLRREILSELKEELVLIMNNPSPEDKAEELDLIIKDFFDADGIDYNICD